MREISFDEKPADLPIYTMLNYGPTRSGKTTFGATWPRPLIIADSIEGGYESVKSMAREQLFESDMPPIIWAIDSASDMAAMATKARPLIESGRIRTIVLDAFSFYCEFYLSHIITLQGGKSDNRAAYGDLGKHLRYVRNLWHLMGVNVVWNCIERSPNEDNPKGGPLIPGAQGAAFPAAVSLLFHSEAVPVREGNKVVGQQFQIHTQPHGPWIAGNRLGAKASDLPALFAGDYRDLMSALGHDVEQITKLIKANTPVIARQPAAAATTPNVPAAKPPVANGAKITVPAKGTPVIVRK